ncbi:MAG: phage tail tip lysozyme [Propionibacteriaceae bacterium]|nr:phage tail tip lysozyme [Propionibacteriaceae bacterium]
MRTRTRVAAVIAATLTMVASLLATPMVAHAQDNNKTAFDFFVGRGLTNEQAAGVVGNLMAESGDPINPRAVQQNGPGRGIAQWSVGERWAALERFAADQGRDPWSLDLQLDFIWHEFNTTEGIAFTHLKGTSTVRDAALSFSSKFERCGVCHDAKRIAYAQRIFDSFAGGGGPAPLPGLAQGVTTDVVNLRSGTNTQAAVLVEIPAGVTVGVECQAKGELISGTYTSDWWARITYNGKTGYATRAYVRIPYGQPSVPECSNAGTVAPAPPAPPAPEPQPQPKPELAKGTTTDVLSLRDSTNTAAAQLAELPPNTTVDVQCQAQGQLVNGTYTTNWWARVTHDGKTGYVSRAYLRIPAGQVEVAVCPDAPKPPSDSTLNGPISRAEVIGRAQHWLNQPVPYSMGANTGDPQGRPYRTDCSGFVSMAFHLDESLNTVSLTGRVTEIPKDELKVGDIVGNLGPGTEGMNGHVVIFNGWVDEARTQFRTIEQAPPHTQSQVATWGSAFYLHHAYRYNNITD